MANAGIVSTQTKSEEELIQENESSTNYARNLGKIGPALREHFKKYPDCFYPTGTAFRVYEEQE